MNVSGTRTSALDDLVSLRSDNGKRLKQRQYQMEGRYPVIDQGELPVGGYTDDSALVYDGPLPVILFGDHTRKVKFVDRPFVIGADGIKVLQPCSGVDPRFAYHQLVGTEIPSRGYARHFSELRKARFWIPHVEEQRRIVAILEDHLSRLDAGTESLNGVLARLEAYRLTLRGSALEGGVGDAVSNPAAWPKLTLDDLQAEGPSSITDGPFGSNLKSSHYTVEGARVIRLQNVGLGEFLNAEAYISLSHFDGLRKHEAIEGDLIVASLGDVLPRVCLLPDLGQPAIVKADCIRIRLGGRVRPQWVLMSMLTPQARRWAKEQLHGVGRMRLGLKAIRGFTLPVPDLDTQDSILSAVDEQLQGASHVEVAARRALRFKDAMRRSLLVAAFSGQLTKESLNV